MFEPLSDHTKRERLDAGNGLVPVLTVGHDAGQCGYFGQPTAVVFSLNLNRECHEVNVPSVLAVYKAMDPTPRGPLAPTRRRSSPVG